MGVTAVEPTDGRRLRREHNREAVIDAVVELFASGRYEPSSAEIAEQAGLSSRSLFRYFDDVDDLTHAAIERQLGTALPLLHLGVPATDSLNRRIEALVSSRLRLYAAIEPGARAARICAHRNPVVARQVADSRRYLRKQVVELFAAEAAGRDDVLAAVDALMSFETFELMRHHQRLGAAAMKRVLTQALSQLLDG